MTSSCGSGQSRHCSTQSSVHVGIPLQAPQILAGTCPGQSGRSTHSPFNAILGATQSTQICLQFTGQATLPTQNPQTISACCVWLLHLISLTHLPFRAILDPGQSKHVCSQSSVQVTSPSQSPHRFPGTSPMGQVIMGAHAPLIGRVPTPHDKQR